MGFFERSFFGVRKPDRFEREKAKKEGKKYVMDHPIDEDVLVYQRIKDGSAENREEAREQLKEYLNSFDTEEMKKVVNILRSVKESNMIEKEVELEQLGVIAKKARIIVEKAKRLNEVKKAKFLARVKANIFKLGAVVSALGPVIAHMEGKIDFSNPGDPGQGIALAGMMVAIISSIVAFSYSERAKDLRGREERAKLELHNKMMNPDASDICTDKPTSLDE